MEKKPLKIAMVLDVYDDPRNGASISTKRFTHALRERGHRVTILSTGVQEEDKIVLKEMNLPLLNRLMEKRHFVFAFPDADKIRDAFKECDVVHVHFPFLCEIRAIQIAKKLNKPVVATLHFRAENVLYNMGLRYDFLLKNAYNYFLAYIYNNVDWVVFPSALAEEELIVYGLKTPGTLISNGVPSIYHPKKMEKNPSIFNVIMVGRLSQEKRQDILIKAIALSRYRDHIQLFLVGDGPQKQKLRNLASKIGVRAAFDYVKPEEVIEYYNRSDLYVHTAEIEVEGMTALEAIACGVPLLVSDSKGSATKQFALNEDFIFRHGDNEGLAKRLDYWIEHPNELAFAREAYLKKATEYSFEKSVDALERLYYHIANKRYF